MSTDLVSLLTSKRPEERDRALAEAVRALDADALLAQCDALDRFRRTADNLYERVRALAFLHALHRYELPHRAGFAATGALPVDGVLLALDRRFDEAIDVHLAAQARDGASAPLSSALAEGYHALAFQTLADQVRHSVRGVAGNEWLFATRELADHALRVRPELLAGDALLRERTPVRMDLSHSGWSDIFFLGMDHPEGARVVNVSIDLAVRGRDPHPQPPIETWLRVRDTPGLRLVSIDLDAEAEVESVAELFDFARDYTGLLKGAVIASGLVPPGLEGADLSMQAVTDRLVGAGRGLEIGSHVRGIPKGSRLAVSTNLLASLIVLAMRATGQTRDLVGGLSEDERRLAAARAILGEWLAGSGGGWQDSGGLWPGAKRIEGVAAQPGDPEWGVSRGRLLPHHHALGPDEVAPETWAALQRSLVLVHGGMSQDVGPILEMVTDRYLLRSEPEWSARREAGRLLDDILAALRAGDIRAVGAATTRNFEGPIRTIVPSASNAFTETLIDRTRDRFGDDFWGFWMLGGMSGGGMGFLFEPRLREEGARWLDAAMASLQAESTDGVPFAIEPVVYDFALNPHGTVSDLARAEDLAAPAPLPPSRGSDGDEEATSLDALLAANGFDEALHEQIRTDVMAGRIGLARNRLPAGTEIAPHEASEVLGSEAASASTRERGEAALAEGRVAVVSLAAGAGSRWTQGAGAVKALHPFARLGGRHRTFLEVHLAKSRASAARFGAAVPHVFTTSYLTHAPIAAHLERANRYGYEGPLVLSRGSAVGLRLVPTERELRFAFEQTLQQRLDERAQQLRESVQAAWIAWARDAGEASDYRDNAPLQCLHPLGHWFEVPNLLRSGTLRALLDERPALDHLLLHNIDTLGADLDPALLGLHLERGAALSFEVTPRHVDDRGGGLARIDGRTALVEGLALPRDEDEWRLPAYNSMTTWIAIDGLLDAFGLDRERLRDPDAVAEGIRRVAARLPTYVVVKEVKKRWGFGQEDVVPTLQFEKLWGDMTRLDDLDCAFFSVPRARGRQIKEPAQLDGWLRDGSADAVAALCDWGDDG